MAGASPDDSKATPHANEASRSAEGAHPGMLAFPAGVEAEVQAHARDHGAPRSSRPTARSATLSPPARSPSRSMRPRAGRLPRGVRTCDDTMTHRKDPVHVRLAPDANGKAEPGPERAGQPTTSDTSTRQRIAPGGCCSAARCGRHTPGDPGRPAIRDGLAMPSCRCSMGPHPLLQLIGRWRGSQASRPAPAGYL
jgi:hypothetical protein